MKTITATHSEANKPTLAQPPEQSPAPSNKPLNKHTPDTTTDDSSRPSEHSPPTFAETKALWALARS
jgi:hypothetical protein